MATLRSHLLDLGLSNRETEIVKKLLTGISNKAIGEALFISEKTVKFHLTSIYRKLNFKSRSETIADLLKYKE